MAYMRGPTYLWRDETNLHVWVEDGYDGWDQTGWGESAQGAGRASGVSIPVEVMDEYVVMRFAQLLQEGNIEQAIARALAKWDGNFGCAALKECATSIPRTL